MTEPEKSIRSETLTIKTTPHVRLYLAELIRDGLHGRTVEEAAEQILREALNQQYVRKDLLLRRCDMDPRAVDYDD